MMISLPLDGDGSLQQQIYRALRLNITTGRMVTGSRFAPSRVLATELAVSRNTVVAAYEQLCAEGYAETKPGAGTFAAGVKVEPLQSLLTEIEPTWSEYSKRVGEVSEHSLFRPSRAKLRYNFLYGEPGYLDLPIEQWARIIGKKARGLTEAQLGYAPASGLGVLRKALAEYLQRSRGVSCDPEQVLIVQGTQEAIELVTRAFVEPGVTAVIEEPHYRGFERCLRAAGAEILAVPVDDDGLQTDALKAVKLARVAYTTPSHQFPLGSILSLQRRMALLDWAADNQTVILEDDYDGEFRYEGRPIPSMQSLDRRGCVIYVGTASKVLFPSLGLGWMVLPKSMVPMFQRMKALSDRNCSTLEQLAFAEFISEGYLERHIHRAKKKHRTRRAILLDTLQRELGARAEIVGTQAGIHILLRLKQLPNTAIETLIERAAANGVGVYSASPYYLKPPPYVELLLGYASLTPAQIKTGVRRLAGVIRSLTS
ncbi:MAG: GntR family transcriptional regulator/MocR family aminotransferase [Candidatus Azotimanducaceae bacterium]|jgi:GntR family transcriptional regulator/MocR family aminotransferase